MNFVVVEARLPSWNALNRSIGIPVTAIEAGVCEY